MSDIVVIGGGIAGLSAAARLSEHFSVTVLEREQATGYHASGRSAAMFEQNYGLGEAYNAGIKIARDLEAKFILLMDQDSIPEPAMVSILRTTYLHLESQGKQIAVVGANYRNNSLSHTSCFLRVGRFGFKRLSCDKTNNFVRADSLISSGSLISLKALNQIGDMDSTLFIDHIDTEWCFRAKAKGFEVYGACTAIMNHLLGDRRLRFWWGRWRMIPCHQPFRYYYMLRNSALLWQRSYMPPGWKRADKLDRLYFLFFFSIFSPNRLANLRMMLKGLIDGLKGRSGQI